LSAATSNAIETVASSIESKEPNEETPSSRWSSVVAVSFRAPSKAPGNLRRGATLVQPPESCPTNRWISSAFRRTHQIHCGGIPSTTREPLVCRDLHALPASRRTRSRRDGPVTGSIGTVRPVKHLSGRSEDQPAAAPPAFRPLRNTSSVPPFTIGSEEPFLSRDEQKCRAKSR
jgi:hypothetical protein